MPGDYTVKAEAYRGMAVGEDTGYPWIRLLHMDRQFLQQLPVEGVPERFPGIHFSAGKFPVACIGLGLRPASEKKTSVGARDDRDRYVNNFMRMRHGGVGKQSSDSGDQLREFAKGALLTPRSCAGSTRCLAGRSVGMRKNASLALGAAEQGKKQPEKELKPEGVFFHVINYPASR
jgi:hypothetical protein